MKNLWAPWRMAYIRSPKKHDGCVFCTPRSAASEEQEIERLIVYRGLDLYVMLNRYPYAAGHLMILPYRHVADVTDMTAGESAEFMLLVQQACRILREETGCDGINVGINLGEAAGAGVAQHLHCHLVPRWKGDSQFIAVMDDVRLIPEALEQTCVRFRGAFKKHFAERAE
ncbi:MAG: HIT domain-containing protein [Mailhella sp.]|nr:HIT domain-containing protein [Mailhella sp.]